MIENILGFLSHPLAIWGGILSVYLIQKNGTGNPRLYEEKIEDAVESDEKVKTLGSQIKLLKGKVESQGHALKVMDKNLADMQTSQSERLLEFNELENRLTEESERLLKFNEQLVELKSRLREEGLEDFLKLANEIKTCRVEITKRTIGEAELWTALNSIESQIQQIEKETQNRD